MTGGLDGAVCRRGGEIPAASAGMTEKGWARYDECVAGTTLEGGMGRWCWQRRDTRGKRGYDGVGKCGYGGEGLGEYDGGDRR